MLDLMKMWIDWRKEVEIKMCKIEKDLYLDKEKKSQWKLLASINLKTVMKGLESPNPIEYLANNLAELKGKKDAIEGAKYICDQKVISLQRTDQQKIKNDISSYQQKIKQLDYDISNIDKVVLRELDNLKEFYRDRKLKVE